MLDKLNALEEKFEALTEQLNDPNVVNDMTRYPKLAKQHRELSVVVEKYREFRALQKGIEATKALLDESDDPEMTEMAREELATLSRRVTDCEQELKTLLLPKDPNDDKNVILEIRAGTGGNEASLFAGELLRMYSRYAERQGWKMQILNTSESEIGGTKEAIAVIEGDVVYSKLKFESGVHRVQRVPQTESSGRIHTSTVTVAVLPEAEEVDIEINPKDLRVDTFCSSGPGGQSVNTTYSAVRITHIPTNTVVSIQDEKSQIKNREKAMRVLRSRLLEVEQEKQQNAISSERRSQVGTGERSEKIRTYNFKENRVSDHRIGMTIHSLDLFMDGDLGDVIQALITHHQAEKLKQELAEATV
ncbi:MAG: peptide chain release factor 1 [Acidobacteria bacterium]|nr:peptide chain release factor 1 [Acidobacteriota bacterium]